jgi:DNA-directed RNA polymerase subunit H
LGAKNVDVTKHELVPKHRILSVEEKEEIKKKYRIKTDSQFPKIHKKDPVIKLLEANKGDLIEILKKNPDIGENIYYRVVVD